MRKIFLLYLLSFLSSLATNGQVITGKQIHVLLDGIVMGGNATLDNAKVKIVNQAETHSGNIIKAIALSRNSNDFNETYVVSYDASGKIIDGMLVAQKGDVKNFRTDSDNEYVWFVGQGEPSVTITADSVLISRSYNQEMKPLGDIYLRHTEKIIFKYGVQDDGTFIQLKPSVETYEIEGQLSTNSDGTQSEQPYTNKKAINPEYNSLSMNVMYLLYSPVSACDKTMEEWTELGHFFKQRTLMMGVPDCDFWSAYYYRDHISDILAQGDGHNMVWFYQHQYEEAPSDMLSVFLLGYDSGNPSMIGEMKSPAYDQLKKAANHLKDKEARKWWKDLIK